MTSTAYYDQEAGRCIQGLLQVLFSPGVCLCWRKTNGWARVGEFYVDYSYWV